MLATSAAEPPEGDGWLHEVKHDGYRIIAVVEGGRARLWSRGGADYRDRAPGVAAEIASIADDLVLDGELVILRPNGTTDFEALRTGLRRTRPRVDLTYMVWDLLRVRGEWLLGCPLLERKARLAGLLDGLIGPIRYVDHIVGNGRQVHRLACELGRKGSSPSAWTPSTAQPGGRGRGSRSSAGTNTPSRSAAIRNGQRGSTRTGRCCSGSRMVRAVCTSPVA